MCKRKGSTISTIWSSSSASSSKGSMVIVINEFYYRYSTCQWKGFNFCGCRSVDIDGSFYSMHQNYNRGRGSKTIPWQYLLYSWTSKWYCLGEGNSIYFQFLERTFSATWCENQSFYDTSSTNWWTNKDSESNLGTIPLLYCKLSTRWLDGLSTFG